MHYYKTSKYQTLLSWLSIIFIIFILLYSIVKPMPEEQVKECEQANQILTSAEKRESFILNTLKYSTRKTLFVMAPLGLLGIDVTDDLYDKSVDYFNKKS